MDPRGWLAYAIRGGFAFTVIHKGMTPYSIEVTTPPDLADWLDLFKLHLSYNGGDEEDATLSQYLQTAIDLFELHSGGRVVLSTGFTQYSPCWPCGYRPLELKRGKVTAVEEVRYFDVDDDEVELSENAYAVDKTGVPALIWHKLGSFPALSAHRPRPVAVEFTAGWAVDAVPDSVKTGIFLLAAHFYEHRGDEDSDIPEPFVRLANLWHTGLTL